MADFLQTLVSLLSGQEQAAAPHAAPVPTPRPSMPMPMQLPQSAPVPQPRPATLPQGTFTPQREPAPDPMPTAATSMPQPPGNPLMELLGGGGAGGDWRQMVRAAGAGMANIGNTGGDPYVAFGRGFGGATGHYDDAEAAAAASGLKAENIAYEREQAERKEQRQIANDAADLELKRLADARAARTSDLSNQKTALEIRREARQNGLSVANMLEIERIAQAAAENIYDPAERRKIMDEERSRLIDQFKAGDGLSDRTEGLSGGDVTATGPNGEKVVLRDGQWVPM